MKSVDFLRKFFFSLKYFRNEKIRVGPGLRLGCWLSFQGPGRVVIGENCTVASMPGCRVGMVTLCTHSPEAEIRMGDNVTLVSARFGARFLISIGGNVIIEDASILDTDFHTLDASRGTPEYENREKCRVDIGDHVRIGARSIITKGVTIGDGSLIYPGAVVQRSCPHGSVLLGNPAIGL